ncbi:MAG: prepilin-type N-terminal cleavage/methylation domain-containing protein [Verrucomicrobia bacterium]|nr:prepilin-type N-terminal cleavage/methylation domain-containing protein [Verrucomicrobiota bacterium]
MKTPQNMEVSRRGEYPQAQKAGFTLVEVALALMVVGIGLMAVFGLFTSGLDTDKASMDDTMSAFFAEDVMSALMAQAVTMRWDRLQYIGAIPAATDQWMNVSELTVRNTATWRTNKYVYNSIARGLPGQQFIEYAVRYRLDVRPIPGQLADYLAYVRLEVLPGEFGATDQVKRFYMELPNMKPR